MSSIKSSDQIEDDPPLSGYSDENKNLFHNNKEMGLWGILKTEPEISPAPLDERKPKIAVAQ